jgi:hypothetical protein
MGSGIDSRVDFFIRWWSNTVFGFFQCTHAVIIPNLFILCIGRACGSAEHGRRDCYASQGPSLPGDVLACLMTISSPEILNCRPSATRNAQAIPSTCGAASSAHLSVRAPRSFFGWGRLSCGMAPWTTRGLGANAVQLWVPSGNGRCSALECQYDWP